MPVCREAAPALRELAPGHASACWLNPGTVRREDAGAPVPVAVPAAANTPAGAGAGAAATRG
jgi:hypothetical protein